LKFFITIFFISFFGVALYASSYNLAEIQNDFYTNVAIKPLYAKYYANSIDVLCKKQNQECYNDFIQKSLKKRKKKFHITNRYWKKAQQHLLEKQKYFTSSQFITLVDLSKQVLLLALWDNDLKTSYPIGFDFISSGNMKREIETKSKEYHFFKTHTGLLDIQSGWRSDGKIADDNVTMPYGQKDSYVFYFGIQKSIRYNSFDINGTKIKDVSKWKLISDTLALAMHAHKSSVPLGRANSHGCIRISNELNAFLDNNLVFFQPFFNNKKERTHPYNKAPKEPKNHPLAGKYLFVLNRI